MAIPDFDDEAPIGDQVTAYDERHRAAYWRLLDAAQEGADWREASALILGLDPLAEPERARRAYDSHLARARWMAETGYRHYLQPPTG